MRWFKNLPPKKAGILALIIANIIWGAASPIFKWALENIPLFVLAYLRFFCAACLLFPLVAKDDLTIAKKHWLPLIGLSISGITINIIFFFLGLEHAPSINAPIISSAGPVFLVLASIFFLHEKPKRKIIIGTLVSLAGVLIIIARPLLENGFAVDAVLGNIYFVIATIGAVADIIFIKEIIPHYRAPVITWWSFVIGAISFFPMFTYQSLTHNWVTSLDIRGITGLIFGIIFSSTVAYSFFTWGVKRIAASEVGLFTYIDPVIATIIAIPLLGEVITPLFILGSLFVFLGIFIAEGRLHYHPFHKLQSA